MSPFARRADHDEGEQRSGARGLSLDLEDAVCPGCRREVPAWQATCPVCGAAAVKRAELPPAVDPLLERLLAQEDEG